MVRLFIGVVATALVVPFALAEDDDDKRQIEEVVVTAERRERLAHGCDVARCECLVELPRGAAVGGMIELYVAAERDHVRRELLEQRAGNQPAHEVAARFHERAHQLHAGLLVRVLNWKFKGLADDEVDTWLAEIRKYEGQAQESISDSRSPR